LFTRTRDFADEFATALSLADQLLMLDIYPAREEPIAGITSQWLLDKVSLAEKRLVSKEELVHSLSELKPQLIVTMGAGDIDRLVNEIKDFFIQNHNH
jgi:UDP-N-acetylmuramate--alanine ligase